MKASDIKSGMVFSRLTVLTVFGNMRDGAHCTVRCECGNYRFVRVYNLINNHTKSCGCFKVDLLQAMVTTHGMSKSPEYAAYNNMKNRCYDPNATGYERYGGRGIKVCDGWLESFDNFFEDMGHKPTSKHSLERDYVDGDYEKNNCRWATWTEQANNRSSNRLIEGPDGKKATIAQVAKAMGIEDAFLRNRVDRGVSVDKLFLAKSETALYEHNRLSLTLPEWAIKLNIPYITLWQRMYKLGWSIDKTLTKTN